MIELMQRLIDTGHAYTAEVTCTSRCAPSRTTGAVRAAADEMQQGEAESSAKRDPHDFTLWKAAKPGEPSWSTRGVGAALAGTWSARRWPPCTWGPSSTSTRWAGPGVPAPRERACAVNAVGDGFARFWTHNAWVTLGGDKMSKSLGNTLSIDVLLQRVRGAELRYYLVAPHYRSMIEYSDAALSEAVAAYGGSKRSCTGWRADRNAGIGRRGPRGEFVEALDDDLSTPGAVAASTWRSGRATPRWTPGTGPVPRRPPPRCGR